MEKKIIEGEFVSNTIGMRIGIVGAVLLTALCLFLMLFIGPLAILCIGPMIGLYVYVICSNYVLKNQQLTVTNTRIYGRFRNKEINLPLNKISHVEITGKGALKSLAITTSSGIIRCSCCTNADAVYAAILNLLNERRFSNKVRADGSNREAYIAEELKVYKKLLDENLITQEEFEAKKRKLLGL